MAGRFEGKTILITGGAMGMGAATAYRLSAEGAVIIIADINEEMGNEVAGAINDRGGRASYQYVDLGDPRSIGEMA